MGGRLGSGGAHHTLRRAAAVTSSGVSMRPIGVMERPPSANSARCFSFIRQRASVAVTSLVSFCCVSGVIEPCAFMLGGKSAEMKRSDPPAWLMVANSLCM